MQEFTVDIAVAMDSWVGMVNMVKCRIVMVTADGSRCVMSDVEALDLEDQRDTRDRVRLVIVETNTPGNIIYIRYIELVFMLI